jgi:hypothetical protein
MANKPVILRVVVAPFASRKSAPRTPVSPDLAAAAPALRASIFLLTTFVARAALSA